MRSFYDISFNFGDASDEDVDNLKYHIIQNVGSQYGWKCSDDIKIMCKKEWYSETVMDIYVQHQEHIYLFCIDKNDIIHLPWSMPW